MSSSDRLLKGIGVSPGIAMGPTMTVRWALPEVPHRVVSRTQATLAWLRDLRRVPCADCGGVFPPHVMDFDHRERDQKRFALAAGNALLKSRKELLAEIAKCDIVCANCHPASDIQPNPGEEGSPRA